MSELKEMLREHDFLSAYLTYNEGNESPEIYHLWAAITGISATLGRKAWLANGNDEIFPNMFTIFVGPPAVRKSTAIAALRRLASEATRVRFAPTDIAGQKQGLLKHLADDYIGDDEEENHARQKSRKSVDMIDNNSWLEEDVTIGSPLDRSSVFVCATEFVSFAGLGSTALMAAISDLYDCLPNYEYKLKHSTLFVDKPVIQLLAGTTPSQLPQIMPPEVINQGLLSRCIFVHADKPRRRIARPIAGDEDVRQHLLDRFQHCFYATPAAVQETKQAMEVVDHLYDSDEAVGRIVDPRLQYYVNRRHTHLRKLTIVVARSAGRNVITDADVNLAHAILAHTEAVMPNALGEYGSSAESRIRQQIIEYLGQQGQMLTFSELHQYLQHACPKRAQFGTIVEDLLSGGKIISVTDHYDPSGTPVVRYAVPGYMNDTRKRTALLEKLRANKTTN